MPEAIVQTVLGPVPADALGPVMTHEHLFFDLRSYWDPSRLHDRRLGEAPFDARVAGIARWDGSAIRDNLAFLPDDDYDLIREELADFADAAGRGGCVVELSNVGLAPAPAALRRLASDTNVHIVAGCGAYVHAAHPEWVEAAGVDDLAEFLAREVADGLAGTDVRPGIIGEIGTSEELQPCEERVLRAAARVAKASGLAINIHMHPPALAVAMQVLDVLEDEGHDLRRTYVSHLDEIWDLDYHTTILERGVVTGFDSFGQDAYFSPTWKSLADNTKARTMVDLVERGFADQLVMAQDICKKHHLLRFGGLGYSHVVRRVVPRLREVFGVDDEVIAKVLVDTPRRLLSVARN